MAEAQNADYTQVAGIISDLDRRLRVLEERYNNLRKKLQLTDQNLVESEKSFRTEIRTLNDDTLKMKRDTNDFNEKILVFQDELSSTAKRVDLKILEKYLALWNPTNFVTRKELKDHLRNKQLLENSEITIDSSTSDQEE